MKQYKTRDPLYGIPIQIFKDVEFNRWQSMYNISTGKHENTVGGFCYINKETGGALIRLNKIAGSEILIHELRHAIHGSLKDRGFTPNSLAGEETYAYLFQYFYKQLDRKGLFNKKRLTVR